MSKSSWLLDNREKLKITQNGRLLSNEERDMIVTAMVYGGVLPAILPDVDECERKEELLQQKALKHTLDSFCIITRGGLLDPRTGKYY